ncbi:MAG: hypothetical protein JWO19_5133 [Bryobacterales bacterium]|nr:hypothetical protein [Bryobacterales bacterium]
MSRRFWIYFLVGLAVVGVAIWGALYSNRGSHLQLPGSILKVRSLPDGNTGAIVFADFRVTNTAAIPFVVSSVQMSMETPSGEVSTAVTLSKSDVDKIAAYYRLLGPKYNDVLAVRDTIPPGATIDRMAAGRFSFPPRFLDSRKTLRLRIEEVDGAVAEIIEKTPAK